MVKEKNHLVLIRLNLLFFGGWLDSCPTSEKRIQTNLAVFEKKEYTIEQLAVDELTILSLGDDESHYYLPPDELKCLSLAEVADAHSKLANLPPAENADDEGLSDRGERWLVGDAAAWRESVEAQLPVQDFLHHLKSL